jgi:hypothetical protein
VGLSVPGRSRSRGAPKREARRVAGPRLCDLKNVGPATLKDLSLLGIGSARELADQDAFELYGRLCSITRQRHDPCVIDVFMSAVDQARGGKARPWWHYTPQRKRRMA